MKHTRVFLSAFIIAFALFSVSAFSQVTIKGKILGSDGKPLPMAQVLVANPDDETQPFDFPAKPDGSYSLKTKAKELVRLTFTGVYHNSYDFTLLLDPKRKKAYDLNIKLAPIVKNDNWAPEVIGDFNHFSMNGQNSIKMTKKPDGTFSAMVPNNSDTLMYQIFVTMSNGAARSINGTQSDFFVYDGGGDYRSGLVTNKKEVEIIFDPNKLYPKTEFKGIYSDDKVLQHRFDVSKRTEDLYYGLLIQRSRLVAERKWDDIDINKNIYVDSLVALYDSEKDNLSKTIIAIGLVKAASDGQDISKVDNPRAKIIAAELLKLVKPVSDIWSENSYLPQWAVTMSEDPFQSKYLNELIQKHSNEKVREYAVFGLLEYASANENQEKQDYYYDMFLKNFPKSDMARTVKIRYAKEKKIEKGKTIPSFKLANLDNPGQFISIDSLRGKYVLIDAWGTWCGPCLAEMKFLDSAYATFKDKNFTIYSLAIDATPDNIKRFRQSKWKMPWLHSYIPKGWDDDITEILEIVGVPRPILIDPEGKIISAGEGLRGEELIKTLSETLKVSETKN